MKLEIGGETLYESFFDPKTGNTIRTVADTEVRESWGDGFHSVRNQLTGSAMQALQERFPHRYGMDLVTSPSPEIVDISITNRCNFGCSYCYQDSKPRLKHGRADLVEAILTGFDKVPYQIALGGGEPTMHPELPAILRDARGVGTVPNYTTNGDKIPEAVLRATNEYCGGVAMTYHTHKGFEWFKGRYRRLREALSCQVNVHLIADRNVCQALDDLIQLQDEMNRAINLVLLAYDPDKGRAATDRIMTRTMYMRDFPRAIKRALGQGMMVAYSEGLLPFFLTRPEIGINTEFATRAEGRFSCYFDSKGRISQSSFVSPRDWGDEKTAFDIRSQTLWEELYVRSSYRGEGEVCDNCDFVGQCSIPNPHAYFICARATHNQLPLESPPEPEPKRRTALERLLEDDDT